MNVRFEKLVEGEAYERPYLADLWGYASYHAISRGVVTPTNTKIIILFVTEKKQKSFTQYNDYLEVSAEGRFLHWEGEDGHSSDDRIINAAETGDEIHLFHREIHHTPFTYMGRVNLEEHIRLKDAPSQFIFTVSERDEVRDLLAEYDRFIDFDVGKIPRTEVNAIVKSRIGQGVFRDSLLRMWDGCAVTGYKRPTVLLASHIKPWRESTNKERLDPYNGLLLQPTLDRLFDKGLVSFDKKGRLIQSKALMSGELLGLGINPKSELRKLYDSTLRYLKFHREHEFEKNIERYGASLSDYPERDS